MKHLFALTMVAFLLPAGLAMAKGPCADDREKFCKDVIAGGGKAGPCLRQHMDELSTACKEKLSKPKEAKATDKPAGAEKPADAKTDAPANITPPTSTPPSSSEGTGGAPSSDGGAPKP